MSARTAGGFRIALLALLWGSGFLWIKISLRGLSPDQIVTARLALGVVVLLGVLLARGQRLPTGRKLWLHLAVAALFGNVFPFLMFGIAEQQVDSAVAGALNGSTPLWTVLIAVAARHEKRLSPLKLCGILLGFLGVLVIFSPWNLGTQVTSFGGLACLMAALSYGISYVYLARFLTNRGSGLVSLSAGQLSVATVMSLALIPLLGWHTPQWRADSMAAIGVLGVLGTGMAYLLNYRIITDDGPTAASVVTYLVPIVAITLGALIVSEAVTPQIVVGIVIVLVGVMLTRRAPRSASHR